jgi:hypothetical protein
MQVLGDEDLLGVSAGTDVDCGAWRGCCDRGLDGRVLLAWLARATVTAKARLLSTISRNSAAAVNNPLAFIFQDEEVEAFIDLPGCDFRCCGWFSVSLLIFTSLL